MSNTSYVDDVIIRETLRMKQQYLNMLALTVGVQHLDAEDLRFMASIDTAAARLPSRVKMNSISGNPPTTIPEMNPNNRNTAAGSTIAEAIDTVHRDEPTFKLTEDAQDFSASMRQQLGNAPATPIGVPMTEDTPATNDGPGELDTAIADGLNEVAPETEREFDGLMPARGHVTPPPSFR